MSPIVRFAKFNGVGALGIVVQLAVLWLLTGAAGVGYVAATVAAVMAALVHNFFWHQRWTWADRRPRGRRALGAFARFVLANGVVSLVGNVILMAVLVGAAGLHVVAANLVAIAVCGIANFWLGDVMVFRPIAAPRHRKAVGLRGLPEFRS